MKIGFIWVCLWLLISGTAFAEHPSSFREAKKRLRILWSFHPETVYCGCKFDKKLNVDYKGCHYQPGNNKAAKRVEWEHIVPASWFGQQRECWREPICEKKNGKKYRGRHCCENIDLEFRRMYTDLHNLVPIIGEVNHARSNYPFGEFHLEENKQADYFHGCEILISKQHRMVEPRDEAKGVVARAYLYMVDTYPISLSKKQLKLYKAWNRRFPPLAWEKEWNAKVMAIQKKDNPYISQYQQKLEAANA